MKIVAVSHNQHNLDELRRLLVADSSALDASFFTGGVSQAESAVNQAHPNLLIFDAAHANQAQLAGIELISLHHPDMAIILLTESQSQEFLTEAMRIGVREVLSLPLSSQSLRDAIWRIQKRSALMHATNHKGKVLAFLACKGGSGATFLAVNLGYILAAAEGKRVALLDLNLNFGNASLFVYDHPPTTTLADLCNNIQRLDASFLASSMVQILPNFGILAAPESPERATEVKTAHLDALIELATRHYDFVILDACRSLDAVNVRALDRADLVFPVLQETLPFIRDAKRLLATFRSLGYGQEKIHLIVNRYEKGGDIRLEDVEHTLGMKVAHTIPNSFKAVSASVNQGIAVMKIAPHDTVTKALEQMGKTLLEVPDDKSGNWLTRLFG
ncbi:pilus assembly protein CpaE [Formivibrio citricus]|uniref:Pilus assembly protein CpaE n=1 Tax=Formivibrio citricus TaxID=83765 RepID=A0A1I4WY20_9NEIS|nr:AAA family ATPase [Formivibrio citricus]SFN18738.1 pilus assembly protein CpaE [Formivibrio citricus]